MPGAPVPLITMSAPASSVAQRLEGRGASAERRRQLLRPLERAAAQHGGPRPALHQLARGQLAHLARAHQQHVLVAQVAEDLARQLHRDVRDGDRVRADARSRCARAWPRPASGCAARSAASPACPPPRPRGRPPSPGRGSAARPPPSSRGWPPRGTRAAPPPPCEAVDERRELARRAGRGTRQERGHRVAAPRRRRRARRSRRGCRWRGSSPPAGPTSARSRVQRLGRRSRGKASASRTASGAVWWLTPTTTITASSAPPVRAARARSSRRT